MDVYQEIYNLFSKQHQALTVEQDLGLFSDHQLKQVAIEYKGKSASCIINFRGMPITLFN